MSPVEECRSRAGSKLSARGKFAIGLVRIEASKTDEAVSISLAGYWVVIALLELEPAFTGKQTLLVFLRDGKPLGDKASESQFDGLCGIKQASPMRRRRTGLG
jgi:hypothetical protein